MINPPPRGFYIVERNPNVFKIEYAKEFWKPVYEDGKYLGYKQIRRPSNNVESRIPDGFQFLKDSKGIVSIAYKQSVWNPIYEKNELVAFRRAS